MNLNLILILILMIFHDVGSGKTAGFLFPIISSLLANGPSRNPINISSSYEKFYPSCLILSPTRELTIQIHKEAQRVYELLLY